MKSFTEFFSQPANNETIALYQSQPVSYLQFQADVYNLATILQTQEQSSWGVFHPEAYPFAVALFALALAQKNIVIPGNNTADTISSLKSHCDAYFGDIPNSQITLENFLLTKGTSPDFQLNTAEFKITVFTSGSSGEAKAIEKSLSQFEAEANALELRFGKVLNNTQALIIATVSHQHIYGLIFRIFWPLLSKRIFVSEQVLDAALVLRTINENSHPVIWVASPAHLKRLPQGEIVQAKNLLAVFSSGGPLSADAADKCFQQLAQAPFEVFGSSETGGIASRQQRFDSYWQPLPDVEIKANDDGALMVKSPHIDMNNWYQCDDAVTIDTNGKFELKGRLDRIIKLEEKRLSLVELEAQINDITWVSDNHCLVLDSGAQKQQRDILACTCQLNPEGEHQLAKLGKFEFIKAIKQQLRNHFELSLIPKKWRFVDHIPSNAQAKIDKIAINNLFKIQ